jgi:hypothetical protein
MVQLIQFQSSWTGSFPENISPEDKIYYLLKSVTENQIIQSSLKNENLGLTLILLTWRIW